MTDEMVFTVTGPTAKPAEPISLGEAGLREREHLQEWVLDHPEILGGDVRIVTFEFGRWTGNDDRIERDRLDILGIDVEGRLVIVELKRDRAPDTVEMQALKYAALASRFTLEELARVHSHYLSRRRGEPVDEAQATAELEEFSDLSEKSLRDPRIMLLASSFPRTVTATVVYMHQQLGLDIDLLAFQAYRTADAEGEDEQILLTVSRFYPPPDVEEFVLSPELSEAKAKKKQRSSKRRDGRTVPKLVGPKRSTKARSSRFAARSSRSDRRLMHGSPRTRGGARRLGGITTENRSCGRPTARPTHPRAWPRESWMEWGSRGGQWPVPAAGSTNRNEASGTS